MVAGKKYQAVLLVAGKCLCRKIVAAEGNCPVIADNVEVEEVEEALRRCANDVFSYIFMCRGQNYYALILLCFFVGMVRYS